MKALVRLYCWQHYGMFCNLNNIVSFYNYNTQRFNIVDSYLYVTSMKRTHCCVLPWQQWLRERTTVLLRTYIAWFVPHSFWFIIQSFIFLWIGVVGWEQVRASSNEQRMNKQRGNILGRRSYFVFANTRYRWVTNRQAALCVCVIKLFVGGRSCNVRARTCVCVCVCVCLQKSGIACLEIWWGRSLKGSVIIDWPSLALP